MLIVYSLLMVSAGICIGILLDRRSVRPLDTAKGFECCRCGQALSVRRTFGDGIVYEERFMYCPSCGRSVRWKL